VNAKKRVGFLIFGNYIRAAGRIFWQGRRQLFTSSLLTGIYSSFANMKNITLLTVLVTVSFACTAQKAEPAKKTFYGMYLQWGYNTETYSRSDIHFKMSNGNNFILHRVKAHDATDFDAIIKKPAEVSIPQYNYRIGFYINPQKTKSIELNFDHAKYVVTNYQKVRVTGQIDGVQVDADSILNPASFLHFEHTDGANFLHINYTGQQILMQSANTNRKIITWIWKAGAGINIPRTDFSWRGDRLNNKFHIAGYNISAESGMRWYLTRHFFLEATGKAGFVNYLNALANTNTQKGNRASHHFVYAELIGTVGFDINF
jgi:hypothetical protein